MIQAIAKAVSNEKTLMVFVAKFVAGQKIDIERGCAAVVIGCSTVITPIAGCLVLIRRRMEPPATQQVAPL